MNCNLSLYVCFLLLTNLNFDAYNQNIPWPEKWTSDVSLTINYSCSLQVDSKAIFISAESSYVEEQVEGKPKQKITLSFNAAELQELLSVLKENNVVGIKTNSSKATSADTEIISLNFSVAGKNYIKYGGTELLQGKSKEHFYSVLNYVDKLIEKKRLNAKIDFIFRFDRSIIQSGKNLQIEIINPPTNIAFKADRIPSSAIINLSPGEYEIRVRLVNLGVAEKPLTGIDSLKTYVKINTRETQQVALLLKDGQLKIK